MHQTAKFLMILGAALAAVGALLLVAQKIPGLGRLPGDVVIERPGWTFYFPLGTSILLSLILSFIFWLFRR